MHEIGRLEKHERRFSHQNQFQCRVHRLCSKSFCEQTGLLDRLDGQRVHPWLAFLASFGYRPRPMSHMEPG